MSVSEKRIGTRSSSIMNALLMASAALLCAAVVLAFPPSAHAVEVQYRLTDVNGVEITDGYTGDAETLQQGLELAFEAWEYTGNEAYESSKPNGLYEPYGPLYGVYFARLGVTCVDDGSSVISVDNSWGIAAGSAFFYSGSYYSPMWYGRVFYPDSGVFIGGRTYRVDITFARENDNHGGFNQTPAIEQTISLSFGTNACQHANSELVNERDATCTDDGYTGDLVCLDCGEVVEAGQVIPALGHDEQWQVVREATEDEPGLEQLVCTRDGEVLQEREIPKLAPSDGEGAPSGSSAESPASGDNSGGAGSSSGAAGSADGGSGSNADDHDQKADAGVGNKGAADTKDGPAQAAAPSGGGAAPSVPSGGSAASSDKNSSAQTQATGEAAAMSSSTGGNTLATSAGAESDVSRVGAKTDADASADSASSDISPSNRVAGNVYRVLGGAAASGESEEDPDDVADEDESQAAALDIQVVGFPILWVLMWASLPTAFAWGLARRYGHNTIGVRRPSRLALFDWHVKHVA